MEFLIGLKTKHHIPEYTTMNFFNFLRIFLMFTFEEVKWSEVA